MTRILALDSACASCSAAILQDGDILADAFEAMSRGQAARLMPMVEEVLAKAGMAVRDMDAVAVTVGPGAFTGIRIGMAAARGLGLAAGLPVIGIATTEVVAAAERKAGEPVLVVLETKRADIYAQYLATDSENAPLACALEALPDMLGGERVLVCGDGMDRARPVLEAAGADCRYGGGSGQPRAEWVARLAADRLKRNGASAYLVPPAPLYLRPPDVSPPKSGIPPRS